MNNRNLNPQTSARRWPGILRIFLLIVLFFLSLLNLFPAPAFLLWLGAILIGEYAVYWISLTLALMLSGLLIRRFTAIGTWIGLVTIGMLAIPLVESTLAASDFPAGFFSVFPGPGSVRGSDSSALQFSKFFRLGPVHSRVYQTLGYGQSGVDRLSLDYYAPVGSGPKPCILVIHGGSWSGGNSQQLPELNSVLASRGYAVASMNYRLAPAFKSPAPLEDVKSALAYLKLHASALHIDTNNIVLLGRSAGAQIALLAAYTLHTKTIRGVIDFYGPADMVWGYSKPANPLVLNSRKVMEEYLGGTYRQIPEIYKESSPIEFAGIGSPPTLLLHGANDALVAFEHSRRLNLKLKQAGVRHYLLCLPWATHGFDYNLNGPGGQLSTYLVLNFLNSVMVRESPEALSKPIP